MHNQLISQESFSSEPETERENPATEPTTMDSSTRTDATESARHSDADSRTDGSKSEETNGPAKQPEGPPPATASARRETSEKKKAANRRNSEKSTGPKTERGKAHSRRNALTHCLLAQKALFTSKGTPQDEGYHALYAQLCDEFPGDDLVTQLRREALLAAYWRVVQSLRYERDLMERNGVNAFQTYVMPNLHRYGVASQKAFAARLQELKDMASSSVETEDKPLGQDDGEVADDFSDAGTPTGGDDDQDSSTGVTTASTDGAVVESEPIRSTVGDSGLSASAVQEVEPTTEGRNESLGQSVTGGPPQSSVAIAPEVRQISGEAESDHESGAVPVIQ